MDSDKQGTGSLGVDGGSVSAQIEANERARQMFEAGRGVTSNGEGTATTTDNNKMTQGEMPEGSMISGGENKAKDETMNELRGMAEINLAWKRNVLVKNFKKNKKVWIGAGATLMALVLVVGGVIIATHNRGVRGVNPDRVSLESVMEQYGEDASESMVATVLSREITNRLGESAEYTYDDAILDYEEAYESSGGELQVSVAYRYAYFIFNNTGDIDKALAVLCRIEPLLSNTQLIGYYSTISNLYEMAGNKSEAERYHILTQDYAARYSIIDDDDLRKEMMTE